MFSSCGPGKWYVQTKIGILFFNTNELKYFTSKLPAR